MRYAVVVILWLFAGMRVGSDYAFPMLILYIFLSCLFPLTLAYAETPALKQECQRIGHKLGSVRVHDCLQQNFTLSGGYSVHGQPLMLKEYPPLLQRRKPLGRVLLIGGTHGDEYAAVSIVFRWMAILNRYHSGMFHWHVVPLLNPDGLLQRHSVRMNAHGVDLNRNMLTPFWQQRTKKYWQHTGHDSRRYPGEHPLSEPESAWLYQEIADFHPDAIVSVHAPYGVLDFDGPPQGPNTMGRLHLYMIGTYPGSLGNAAGVQHHIPVVTVELPYAGIMPSARETSAMWRDLIHWLRQNVPKDETRQAYQQFDRVTESLKQSASALE